MENEPVLVVDASVVTKWYLLDEDSLDAALALRSDFEEGLISIVMPDVARYEVANALTVAWRRKRIREADAQRAIADFLAWDFAYAGTDELIISALDAARRYDCALYDALYVTLAEDIGASMITADRALVAKTGQRAPWVKWLGDYVIS